MNRELAPLLVAVLLIGFLCLSVGIILGSMLKGDEMRSQAVERGYATYCPQNGNWAWKGECDE